MNDSKARRKKVVKGIFVEVFPDWKAAGRFFSGEAYGFRARIYQNLKFAKKDWPKSDHPYVKYIACEIHLITKPKKTK